MEFSALCTLYGEVKNVIIRQGNISTEDQIVKAIRRKFKARLEYHSCYTGSAAFNELCCKCGHLCINYAIGKFKHWVLVRFLMYVLATCIEGYSWFLCTLLCLSCSFELSP